MSDEGGAPKASDEQQGLALLRGLRLLDAPTDPAFDALLRAARHATGCAAAAINLMGRTHVHALASMGLPRSVVLRERSLCPQALAAGTGFFEVPDTARDAPFAALPDSAGSQRVRSYAGVPLWVEGAALGTLCVMHDQPRALSAAEREQFEDLALVASALLRGHCARQALGEEIETLRGPATGALRQDGAGPASAPDTAPSAAPSPVPTPSTPTPPRTVLYIEDEPLNVVLMEEIFRGQPAWALHVARDGSEGVETALAIRPDLALIDMNLPDFNGIEVLRRLRAEASLQGLRCIALSADSMPEQIAEARAAGFDDYWTKPIDLTRLLAAIAKVFEAP